MATDLAPTTTEKIKKILNKHGISERQQIKTVATILDMAYVSARQKFAGERSWTSEQLARIARYFKEPIEELTEPAREASATGILLTSKVPQRCICETGDALLHPEQEAFIARQEGDTYMVTTGDKAEPGVVYFRVTNIAPLPPPRIASLDDVPSISAELAVSFASLGMVIDGYIDPVKLISDAKTKNFECYILDWTLGNNMTAAEVIHKIRGEISTYAPIMILTGDLRTLKLEDTIAKLIAEYHDISVMEKPQLNNVMASALYKRLFFIESRAYRN